MITVPVTAIVQKDGRSAVWVVRQGSSDNMEDLPGMPDPSSDAASSMKTAHLVTVTTGVTNGSRIEIVSGLTDGDEVIYQGNRYLHEGDEVFPTRWGPEGPAELPKAKPMPGMEDMPGMKPEGGHSMPGMK